MYQIIAHAKPKKDSEYFKKFLGAYATIFIDFKEINGAHILAKHYIEDEGWENIEFEEEYFIINSIEDMSENYQQQYNEAIEYGYSLILNVYDNEDDE